jgi:hypothetical protein
MAELVTRVTAGHTLENRCILLPKFLVYQQIPLCLKMKQQSVSHTFIQRGRCKAALHKLDHPRATASSDLAFLRPHVVGETAESNEEVYIHPTVLVFLMQSVYLSKVIAGVRCGNPKLQDYRMVAGS